MDIIYSVGYEEAMIIGIHIGLTIRLNILISFDDIF
jgi:hypothetical protein